MQAPRTIRRKPLPDTAQHAAYGSVHGGNFVVPETASEEFERSDGFGLSRRELCFTAAIVLGCTLVILIAVISLTFLWFGGPTETLWISIVLSNWIATSVAVCAVAIRWMSALQMTFCTSMLAWKMLREGSLISRIPRISTLRYNNAGPLDLLPLLCPWPVKAIHPHLFIVALLSIFNSSTLQFSSTLLLSDLAAGPVGSFEKGTTGPIFTADSYSVISSHFYNDVVMTTAPSYPLFAEYSQNSRLQHFETVDDTGSVVRALLPISAASGRSKLLSFKGNATLYDARWICTQPKFSDLKLSATSATTSMSLTGHVNHSVYIPPMASNNYSEFFNCTIPPTQSPDTAWTLVTCKTSLQDDGIGLISSLESVYNTSVVHAGDHSRIGYDTSNGDSYIYSPLGDSWLVVNVTNFDLKTVVIDGWNSLKVAFDRSDLWAASSRGPWAQLTSTQRNGLILTRNDSETKSISEQTLPVDWSFALDVSLCSSAFPYTKNMYVNAKRNRAVDEPVSLEDGMSQVNVSRSSRGIEARGIMVLNETELFHQLALEREMILQNHLDNPVLPISRNSDSRDYAFASDNSRFWYPSLPKGLFGDTPSTFFGVSEDRAALFQRVIRETNSPALAMQSMQHTILTDRYYKYMPYYNKKTAQRLVYSVDAIHPVRTRGFSCVMVGIGIHFFLFAYILIVFGKLQRTKRTLRSVDQAWLVFAQVALLQNGMGFGVGNEDYHDRLFSTTTTDYDVERSLKSRGLKNKIFVLEDEDEAGVVQFRPKHE